MLSIPKFNEQLYSATIYSPQNAPKGGSIYMYLQKILDSVSLSIRLNEEISDTGLCSFDCFTGPDTLTTWLFGCTALHCMKQQVAWALTRSNRKGRTSKMNECFWQGHSPRNVTLEQEQLIHFEWAVFSVCTYYVHCTCIFT